LKPFLTFLAAYVLSQFYRSFLAVIAPELAHDLSLGPQALANMQAFWILGFVVMQFPVGWALDTIGPRSTVSSLMLVAVAGAVVFAYADTEQGLDLAMALIGIGCSAIYMAAIYVFGRSNRPERFALFCSGLLGLGAAGNLLATSPLAWMSAHIGWRSAMMMMACATAASTVSIFMLIPKLPHISAKTSEGFRSGIVTILKTRAIWPLVPLTLVSYSIILAERGLWAGPYFSLVHGLDTVERGTALLVMAAAMSAGALIYGPLDRIFGTHKWVVVTGSAITTASFFALATFNMSLTAALLALAMIGGFGMTYGVLMAHSRTLFPDHLLGRGITFMNVLFIGGAGLLQPLSGAYMNMMNNAPPFIAYARLHLAFGLLLLGALGIYLLSSEKRNMKTHEAKAAR